MNRLNWIAAVLIVLLAGGNVGAYIGLSDYYPADSMFDGEFDGERLFSPWVPLPLFEPLAKVESVIRRPRG